MSWLHVVDACVVGLSMGGVMRGWKKASLIARRAMACVLAATLAVGFVPASALAQDATSGGEIYFKQDRSNGPGEVGSNAAAIAVLEESGKEVCEVDLGYSFSAAILDDGSLWTWGRNAWGNLGDGTLSDRTLPVEVFSQGVRSVSLGESHAAAVLEDGSLWVWGYNAWGQLGIGRTNEEIFPEPIELFESGVSRVELGSNHSAALFEDGTLMMWGGQGNGELGNGEWTGSSLPVKVDIDGVVDVSLGVTHSAAVTTDGALWTWGSNIFGQLGTGDTTGSCVPQKVISEGSVDVESGGHQSAVIMSDGTLLRWGAGRTLDDVLLPTGTTLDNVKSVSVGMGGGFYLALLQDGSLWVAGNNTWGQLGTGTTDYQFDPVRIRASGVTQIAAGGNHAGFVTQAGELFLCGYNAFGQLGIGSVEERHWPVLVAFERGGFFESLHADDPLAQVAACELTDFDAGSFAVGDTVSEFLNSGYFENRVIWSGLDDTYEDLFSKTLGGYEIVASNLNSHHSTPYIALKHPDSGDVILALKTDGPDNIADMGVPAFLDESVEIYAGIENLCPGSNIYLTGAGIGGQAAAYVSVVAGVEATTFNSSTDVVSASTFVAQAPMMTGNEFNGIDDTSCLHFCASSLEDQGYSSDLLSTATVEENGAAEHPYDLCSLYEATEGGYEFCSIDVTLSPSTLQSVLVPNVEEMFWTLAESFAEFVFTPSVGFPSLDDVGSNFSRLSLGTTGRDVRNTGLDNAEDYVIPQVVYTGEAHGDAFTGGQTADVFVAGEGGSAFTGGAGSDLYIIGDGARVSISDVWSTDGNVFCDGAFGLLKLVGLRDPTASLDVVQAAVSLIGESKQDTVMFRNCSFSDMEIELQDNFLSTDYYIITAGDTTVQIPKRSFVKKDFLIVDASGHGEARAMDLDDLYDMKHPFGRSADSVDLLSAEEGDSSNVVTFNMTGDDVRANVVDIATGEVVAELVVNETRDVCLEHGTFCSSSTLSRIDGAYDASKLRVDVVDGECDRIATNRLANDTEGDVSYTDNLDSTQYERVELRSDGSVTIVGIGADGQENLIETEVVESGDADIDEPDQPTPPTPVGPTTPVKHEVALDFDTELGNAGLSSDAVAKGEGVSVSAIPLFGYDVGSVTVTDAAGNEVEVVRNNDGTWSFVMPDGAVSVSVEFAPTAWENPFADVTEDDWFYDAVRRVNLAGLMTGYDNGSGLFGSNDELAREQAARVMWNAFGEGNLAAPAAPLSDALQGEWYSPAVNWAVEHEVMTGYDGTDLFGVGEALTREQFVKVIANWVDADLSQADSSMLDAFPDADSVSVWATDVVAWGVEAGLIEGFELENGTRELQANRPISRAEMAKLMMNAIDAGVLELS